MESSAAINKILLPAPPSADTKAASNCSPVASFGASEAASSGGNHTLQDEHGFTGAAFTVATEAGMSQEVLDLLKAQGQEMRGMIEDVLARQLDQHFGALRGWLDEVSPEIGEVISKEGASNGSHSPNSRNRLPLAIHIERVVPKALDEVSGEDSVHSVEDNYNNERDGMSPDGSPRTMKSKRLMIEMEAVQEQFKELYEANTKVHSCLCYTNLSARNEWWAGVVEGQVFKLFSSSLIIGNGIFCGVEVDQAMKNALKNDGSSNDDMMWIAWCNYAFAAFFFIELVVRMFAYGKAFWFGPEWRWNVFDAFLVFIALVEAFLDGTGVDGFSSVRLLRVVRVAKTLRVVRVVTLFRNLQVLLQSILNSFLCLLWAVILLLLVMYLMSIVCLSGAALYLDPGVETDDPPDAEVKAQLEEFFPSVLQALFSMFYCVTGGEDWSKVLHPLVQVSGVYAIFFSCYIFFVLFGVFNALTAVFVESVLNNRDKDVLIQAEMARTGAFMRDMAALFRQADADGEGHDKGGAYRLSFEPVVCRVHGVSCFGRVRRARNVSLSRLGQFWHG